MILPLSVSVLCFYSLLADETYLQTREVVVTQLVERLLPILEIGSLNPVIGKNLLMSNICILSTVY